MKKVVYLIGSLGRGGAESQTVMLAAKIQECGYRSIIFVLEAGGDLEDEATRFGVPVVSGGYDSQASRVRKIGMLIRVFFRLQKVLSRERPDVIHGVLPLANLFAALGGRVGRVPFIVTSRRALNTHQDRVPGWRHVDRLSSLLSHVLVANSEAVKRDTIGREGTPADKIHVIYNGVELSCMEDSARIRTEVREELGITLGAPVAIMVANLIPYKGHRDALSAMALLQDDLPDLRFVMVGEDRGIGVELRVLAETLGVANNVIWLGLRKDIARLLAAADIYVSASHEEGFSNALLEALAAGKEIIATRVGGNPELLGNGALGRLVSPRSPSELADAVRVVVRAEGDQRASADSRRKALERYSPQHMVKNYLALYGFEVMEQHTEQGNVFHRAT